jgi:long-subunit fatty acid transport protein
LRPDPKIITKPIDTVSAQWYQYIRERKGTVYGITPGVAVPLFPGLTLGGSATILTGSSDDNEQRVERGHIYLATNNKATANDFMLDTAYYQQSKVGTSSYSGKIFTVGLMFQQDRYSIGVTVKPSYTLTRSWDRDVNSLDTTKKPFPVRVDSLTRRSYHESGQEDLKFPMAYSLGIVLTPTDKWTIAFDYEVRNLADMELTSSMSDSVSHPWVSNSATMRFGAEYRVSDMLALRGGYREDIQAFSPDGSAVIDEPARGGIYSLGAGFTIGNILIDLAYEYSVLKYQDIYQSNVNYNAREQHQFIMEVAYRF